VNSIRPRRAANLVLEANRRSLGVCLVSIPKGHQPDATDSTRLYGLPHNSIEIGDL
jgi:hypothetical protein